MEFVRSQLFGPLVSRNANRVLTVIAAKMLRKCSPVSRFSLTLVSDSPPFNPKIPSNKLGSPITPEISNDKTLTIGFMAFLYRRAATNNTGEGKRLASERRFGLVAGARSVAADQVVAAGLTNGSFFATVPSNSYHPADGSLRFEPQIW